VSSCRLTRRIASMILLPNASVSAVEAGHVVTKVSHGLFPSCWCSDGAGRWRLTGYAVRRVSEQQAAAWPAVGGAIVQGFLRSSSHRVARQGGCTTSLYFIFGDEMKKNRHKGLM
jgi:hypothetical protein